jgi:hypothetical protein
MVGQWSTFEHYTWRRFAHFVTAFFPSATGP